MEFDYDKFPEWIQAIGALVASIGLVITLLLQRKTLIEQQKITTIEYERYLKNFLPLLELGSIAYFKEGQERRVAFMITIKENYLQKLSIKHNFPNDYEVPIPYIISDVILPKEYHMEFSIKYTLSPVFVEVEEIIPGYEIHFLFEDALQNKYQQRLVFRGSTNVFLYPAYRI